MSRWTEYVEASARRLWYARIASPPLTGLGATGVMYRRLGLVMIHIQWRSDTMKNVTNLGQAAQFMMKMKMCASRSFGDFF